MTIHDLRKMIKVHDWVAGPKGAYISYNINNTHQGLKFNQDTLCAELIAISSIDNKEELINGYKLSQWDALSLVIRHEYAKFVEGDIMEWDIGKSINNLLNNTNET